MSRRTLRAVALAVLVLVAVLIAIRLVAPVYGERIALASYRSMQTAAYDDEVPALSIPVSRILLWPWHREPQRKIFEKILHEDKRPNDILVFSAAQLLGNDLSREEAKRLFSRYARQLDAKQEDRMYLLVALLPLAIKGGVCLQNATLNDIADGYRVVQWPTTPGDPHALEEKRWAFGELQRECGLTHDGSP